MNKPAHESPLTLLTVKEAATRLCCSATNVYSLIDKGELPVVCVGSVKGYRIDPRDIERFIDERKSVKTGPPARRAPTQPKLKHIKF